MVMSDAAELVAALEVAADEVGGVARIGLDRHEQHRVGLPRRGERGRVVVGPAHGRGGRRCRDDR